MDAPSSRPRTVIKERLRDSTHWDTVRFRPDDIVIASCYKSGTTLAQQIVNLLINGPSDFESMRAISPWVDSSLHFTGPEAVEALPSPRFLKSHLPFNALPYHAEWKYIYLGRDGRDVCVSLFNHCKSIQEEMARDNPGNDVDHGPDDFPSFWDAWLETGRPRWEYWRNIASWWQVRELPNVLLVHYSELIKDKPKAASRIAGFLGLPWDSAIEEMVCHYSSLEQMKGMEMAGKFGSSKVKKEAKFINKGTNGRWRDLLSNEQIERYLSLLGDKLEPACIDWLHTGARPDMER